MFIREFALYPLRLFFDNIFSPVYKRRVAEHVSPLCKDDSVILDVGCDDGTVAKMIMVLNPSLRISGIDIQANRPAKIPRQIYDGQRIPYPGESFDIVMALDVLHHTEDISILLKEMRSTTTFGRIFQAA